jgi:hypothetical protein
MNRVWDRPRILRMIKQLHARGRDLSYSRMARAKQALVSAAAYHFGSYRRAVEKAGIDYARVMRRPRWTKPAIIRLIKQARREGEDLHWSAVSGRRDELGRAAFASLQRRLFGSWDRALHAAGLDADQISIYRKWSQSAIVADLKERHRDDEPLNSGHLQREDPGMHAAAIRHFGSYDGALRAAGLNPARLRQRRRWTRDAVIKELRAFGRRHRAISDSQLRRQNPALYGATLRQFGSLEAARRAVARRT